MSLFRIIAVVALGLLAAACDQDRTAQLPPPQEPGPDAVGTICRMALSEHGGPKGQVFLNRADKPLWFSSVRDTFTWLLIGDGTGNGSAAIWVNDMGKSKDWDRPDAGAWVEARQALFVVGSNRGAQMGGSEFVPFSDRSAAANFATAHGGKVVAFAQITRDLLDQTAETQMEPGMEHGGRHHE